MTQLSTMSCIGKGQQIPVLPLMAQYATAGSGPDATEIGWIDFGKTFEILNGQQAVTVTNRLAGGLTVSFDLSLSVSTDPSIASEVGYQSFPAPSYSLAPFGQVAYTGLDGYPALLLNGNYDIKYIEETTLTLTNFKIIDQCGRSINSFTFYVADAETTNKGKTSVAEIWTVEATPSVWSFVDHIPSVSNTLEGPTPSGLGTAQFVETGIGTPNADTSAFVVSTPTPTTIIAKAQIDGGREGFAFGFAATPLPNNSLPPQPLNSIPMGCKNKVTGCSNQKFTYCTCGTPIAILWGSTLTCLGNTPVTIQGNLGTYTWKGCSVTFTTSGEEVINGVDSFILVCQCGGKVSYEAVLFVEE